MHGTIVSEPLEEYLGREDEARNWGITVRDVTAQMALGLRYPSADGVMVTGVRPGKPAEKAQPQISRGDVILDVDGVPVENLEDFIKAIRKLEEGQESLSAEDVTSVGHGWPRPWARFRRRSSPRSGGVSPSPEGPSGTTPARS